MNVRDNVVMNTGASRRGCGRILGNLIHLNQEKDKIVTPYRSNQIPTHKIHAAWC